MKALDARTPISVAEFALGCGFHAKRGESCDLATATLGNMCPTAYYTLYPYILSALYDGAPLAHCRCNCDGGASLWRISAHEYRVGPLIRGVDWLLQRFGQTRDAIARKVILTVAEMEDSCACEHVVGQSYTLDILRSVLLKRELFCPASFDAAFPYWQLVQRGFPMPWSATPRSPCLQCPSDKHRVVYAFPQAKMRG
jgi:uncharacterized repeat protein (TIGR04076 family)